MKGTIIYNETKEKAERLYEKLKQYFNRKNIDIVSKNKVKEVDFAVVLGGDGTLLRASKILSKKNGIDIFAINVGTLGFLTEIKEDEFFRTFENYLNGDIRREKRRFLSLKVNNRGYEVLNEVVISKTKFSSKMIDVVINGESRKVCSYRADGVIVATPTGSTAYSLSAGGPIVMPKIKAMVITPIAPHNLTSRTIVIDGNEKLTLYLEKSEEALIMIDGDIEESITTNQKVEIYYSDKNINLILPEDRDYYSILREKLKWGDNLC